MGTAGGKVTSETVSYPMIIQGGMGVAISSWPLARAVSMRGQLGVVSGTAIDVVMTRRLQLGDVGGDLRRAFERFPIPEIAERVWERYFVPGGKAPAAAFKTKPIYSLRPSKALVELIVLANFVEVTLAKEGHDGAVGINLLEKVQLPTLPSLFGAMLAGVDYVIMGAGIPRAIPGVLDRLAAGQETHLDITVVEPHGAAHDGSATRVTFNPGGFGAPCLTRPKFLAVVSSNLLAQVLARRSSPTPDGFVIEGPTAGGHNAPPRGEAHFNELGEPVYGEKDVVDLAKVRDLGLPFWLAGSYAGKLREAVSQGAEGIQVGTAFAFCDESGMRRDARARALARSVEGSASVYTDPKASPTGFPFKVVEDDASLTNPAVYETRERICDLGGLRDVYRKPDGTIGYRCPGEPVEDYLAKGGKFEDTVGRMCLCNCLLSAAGFAQVRKGVEEPYVITAGDDVANIGRYLKPGCSSYSADDVIDVLMSDV